MSDLYCRELLNNFVSKYLNNDIDRLKHFNFSLLESDKEFGNSDGYFDEDDSKIAKAIYCLVWQTNLPDLKIENIGSEKLYRGDTLNTFNTLFGKKNELGKFMGVDKFSIQDTDFHKLIEDFHKRYLSIGNFILLPNISAPKTHSPTINTYRGICSWRDYFDKFLTELNLCYQNSDKKDESLSELFNLNNFYFSHIETMDKFNKINFLSPYFENDKTIKALFSPYLYHWQMKNISDEYRNRYISFSKNYISKVLEIIDYRADIIISILKNRV